MQKVNTISLQGTLLTDTTVYGIRQVDDLVLWVAYKNDDIVSEQQADNIIKELLNTDTGISAVYDGGLTLEVEEYTHTVHNNIPGFRHDFAGTVITGNMDGTGFECRTLNKNWDTIRVNGKQQKARYPPAHSYIHERIKIGVIIGSFIRMRTQNTGQGHLTNAIREYLYELWAIDYEKRHITRALYAVGKKPGWRDMTKRALNYVNYYLYA